jgi:MFS family permease
MGPEPPPSVAGPVPRVLVQVGLAQAAVGFAVAGTSGALLLLARDLRADYAQLAWVASAFGAGLLLVGATFRTLLRRGPQPLLRAAALTAALGAVLLATGPTAPVAIAGGLLLGLGNAALTLLTPALLHGPDAGRLLARATGIASVAGILAAPVLALVDTAGPSGRLGFAVVAVPLLVLAVTARRPGTAPDQHPPQAVEERPGPLRHVVRRWSAVVLAVAVEFCFVVWGVVRLQDTGLSPAAATGLSTVFAVGMGVGRLGAARLAHRGDVVLLAGLLVAAATVLTTATASPAATAAGLGAAGLAIALLYPTTLSRLLAAAAPQRGAAVGALASGTAILLAPPGLGLLAGLVDLRVALPVAVLPLTLALVLVDRSPAPRARP